MRKAEGVDKQCARDAEYRNADAPAAQLGKYQYAHDAMELKMLGPIRVKRELLQRGIAPEIAENAISTAEEEIGSPEKRLEELIELKYKNMLFDEKNRAKVVNSLFRLGYEYDMIKETLYKIE